MALTRCRECNETVSTKAIACPHCDVPQKSVPPPLPPESPIPPARNTEGQIYSDGAVTVTTSRVIIGGATYALRNVTPVKMLYTRPRVVKPILLLVIRLMILLAAFFR